MKALILTIGVLGISACASTPQVVAAPTAARFGDVSSVVIAPPGGLVQVITEGFPVMPRFPRVRLQSNTRVDPTVAFVVDTTGVIETHTLSFLNDVPADYRVAICDWSRTARFEPLNVGGVKQRSLGVSAFTFFRSDTPFPMPPGGRPNSAEGWLTQFREIARSEVFSRLEKRIHC